MFVDLFVHYVSSTGYLCMNLLLKEMLEERDLTIRRTRDRRFIQMGKSTFIYNKRETSKNNKKRKRRKRRKRDINVEDISNNEG